MKRIHGIQYYQLKAVISPRYTSLTLAFFGTLQCLAVHSTNISSHLKNDILRAGGDDKKVARKSMTRVIREFQKVPSQRYLMGTSQAVDIIDGGVKG